MHARLEERLRSRQVAELDPTQLLLGGNRHLGQLLLIGGQHLGRGNSGRILGENSHTTIVASSRNVSIGKGSHSPNRDDRKVESLNDLTSFPHPHASVFASSNPGIAPASKESEAVDVVRVA